MAQIIFEMLAKRFQNKIETLDPKSMKMREALTRIGLLVTNDAKIVATRQGVVDRGSLRRSINYQLFEEKNKTGVRISPFGTRYAALNEFGGPFTRLMQKAMFATLRDAGKLNTKVGTRKNVIVGQFFRARPYLGPALQSNVDKIIDLFQSAISNSNPQSK